MKRQVLGAIYNYLEQGGELDEDSIVEHLTSLKKFSKVRPKNLRVVVKNYTDELETPQKEPKVQEKPKKPDFSFSSSLNFSNIGGMESIMKEIQQLVVNPINHPEVYYELKIEPARGILLCGPPGTGKTYLAHAISGQLQVPFFKVSAPEIVTGMSGESEKKLREVFQKATEAAPSVLFLDEIDAITPKRSNTEKGMEKRIVSQLLTCMDDLGGFLDHGKIVIVLAATNRIESIDPALRRAGRFDREIHFGIPSEVQRKKILEVLVKNLKLRQDLDISALAKKTPGYVGADLHSIVKEAGNQAIIRIFSGNYTLESVFIEQEDFLKAINIVQPSSKREGFTTIPDTNWENVGGLETFRQELYWSIVHPINQPEKYEALGISTAAGVLLSGPPGCGKTLLAKAVANEAQANFIAVNGPELLNKYVGESEKAVRQLFQRARDSAPCIIFFDEIDSMCAARGGDNQATERVVNQLLTELNGLQERQQVFVIAATNRPDIIDPAMLRPGRLDKNLFIPLPSLEDRISILNTHLKVTQAQNINLEELGQRTQGFSGADLASLVREAASLALRQDNPPYTVAQEHLNAALNKVSPSVTPLQHTRYEQMRHTLKGNHNI